MRVVHSYPMLKRDSISERFGYFHMPPDAEIVSLEATRAGPLLVVLQTPNARCLTCPVVFAALGEELIQPAGREIGKILGTYQVSAEVLLVIAQVLPWPEELALQPGEVPS